MKPSGFHQHYNRELKMSNDVQQTHKCTFCDKDATSMSRLFVGNFPDNPTGFLSFDYYGETVYTCGKHFIQQKRWNMKGEPLSD